jgi:hypothetical protein
VNSQAGCVALPFDCQQVDSSGSCSACVKGFGLNATTAECVDLPTDCV